jgi:hypothetical protein
MQDEVLVAPTVNLGGTSRSDLINGYCESLEALNTALAKVRAITPHPRDFPGAAPVWMKACEHHTVRTKDLERIIREISTIAERVAG